MLFELVAAGIEGGSKRAIEDDWSLQDVDAIRRHWAEHGPPTHIAVAIIAEGFGAKLRGKPSSPTGAPALETDPMQGLGDLPVVPIQRPKLGLPV